MADERDPKKPRGEQTQELQLSELDEELFEAPTGELELSELEPIELPGPPPTPGLGRPAPPPAPPKKEKTLQGFESPDPIADAPADDAGTDPDLPAPEPRAERQTNPPRPQPPARKLGAPRKVGTPPLGKKPLEKKPAKKTKKKTAKKAPTKTKRASKKSAKKATSPSTPPAKPKRTTKRGQPVQKRPAATEVEATAQALAQPAAPVDAPATDTTEMEAVPPRDEALEADVTLRDLCEEQLERGGPPDRAAQLHYELGRLFEVRFRDDAKAADHYQSALRARADHAAALRGARRTLARLGRHAALPPLFDSEVAITREPQERARLLYAKGRLLEEELRQNAPALAVYREALALDPGNLVVLKAIERSLRRDKAWAPLVKTYESLANAAQSGPLRAAWTAVRAHLTETKLGDPVQAAALYEAALEADPHATSALAHVKRLATKQKRWPQLVDAMLTEHSLADDADTRLAILVAIAGIEERRMGDAEAAAETLSAALEAAPKQAHILRELARLHRARGRHREEIEALVALVDLVDAPDAKAQHCHRIGHLYDQTLAEPENAQRWYERTLSIDSSHRAAALALVRLLEQKGAHSQIIAVWERRARDGVHSPTERAELHHQIGTLLERELRDPVSAMKHHAKAIGLDPDHHAAFSALARLYAAAARWQELTEIYERAIGRAPHDDEAIMWLFRLGAVREDRLSDPAGAMAAYERVLERDPSHFGALHALVRAATRAGEYARVVEALKLEASLTKDPVRGASLLHRAAGITARECGDPAAASRALEELLRTQPKHRPSLESLASLLSDAGRWRELVSVYRRLLPLTSTAAEKVQLHHRMGEIHETQIGDDKAAITAYRAALMLDAEFEPAREALLGALRRTESWAELATALEGRIDRLPTPIDRAHAATELGELQESRLDNPEKALAMYEKALEEVSLYRPALDARERLLTDKESWNELCDALAAEVDELSDPFLRMQTALRAALVRGDQQGAVGPALAAFRPVFEQHPEHIGALLAVEAIYARTRDEGGLAATYSKMAQVVRDPKAKLSALKELARARAAAGSDISKVLRQILEHAPDDVEALTYLAQRAHEAGDVSQELTMHARLASTAADPRVGAFHQTRVGELLLEENKPADALAAFQAASALDATSLAATRGLSRAALGAEDAAALRFAALRERDLTQDKRVAVALLLRAALVRMVSGEIPEAVTDYESAIALDPDCQRAAAGLRATLGRPDQAPQLIDLLGRAALACSNPDNATALHLSVAELHAEVRDDLAAAVAAARRALEHTPDHHDALFALADYLERNGRWEEAVEAFERLVPRASDEQLVDIHLRVAKIAEDHLGDPERAIRSLRVVLSREEDNEHALGALVRLERLRGRHEEALRIAKKLIQVVTSDGRKAAVLTELAELERTRGQDAAAAASAFTALGIQGPSQRAAVVYKDLIANVPEHATWDNYATALMTFIERNGKTKSNALSATYRELAWVFSEASNRPDRAIATLREGVQACPTDPGISLALVKALRELSANDKALVELRRFTEIDAWNPEIWRALAEVFRATGEPDGAAIALAPLVASKQGTEQEEKIVRARRPQITRAPGGILGKQGLEQIIDHGGLHESAAALVHAMTDALGKLEGFDHERHGVAKRDRIKHGEPHPVRAFADRIGMTFGVPEYDLYMVDSGELTWASVYAGSPACLVVPKHLETARDPVLAFHLARPLAMMSRLLHPVDRIDPVKLERILVGAARQFEPGFTLRDNDPDLERETKRVGKAIGFFARSRIQDAATTFAAAPTRDIARWSRDVRRMAARAALLVSDDLLAAYEALGSDVGSDDLVADLARFWISDPAMRFRRRVAQQI